MTTKFFGRESMAFPSKETRQRGQFKDKVEEDEDDDDEDDDDEEEEEDFGEEEEEEEEECKEDVAICFTHTKQKLCPHGAHAGQ